jgi:hypothetical protein
MAEQCVPEVVGVRADENCWGVIHVHYKFVGAETWRDNKEREQQLIEAIREGIKMFQQIRPLNKDEKAGLQKALEHYVATQPEKAKHVQQIMLEENFVDALAWIKD